MQLVPASFSPQSTRRSVSRQPFFPSLTALSVSHGLMLLLAAAFAFLPAAARAQSAVFSGLAVTLGGGFKYPVAAAVDLSGNVYIVDYSKTAVMMMPAGCASSACVTTIGGGFYEPNSIAVDSKGNVYVADAGHDLVKKMPAGCASAICVTAFSIGFANLAGIALDSGGNLYVAGAGYLNMLSPGCDSATCMTALGVSFGNPGGIAVDGAGNVYVADNLPGGIEEIPAGCASPSCLVTLGCGLNTPVGVAVDINGNVYVADQGAGFQASSVKEIPPGCASASCVTTLGVAVGKPWGVAVDAGGDVYIADGNGVVSEVMSESVNFFSVPVGSSTNALSVKFRFTSSVTLGGVGGAPNFSLLGTGTCFTQNSSYTAGKSCTVDVKFSPGHAGALYGSVQLYNNASPAAVIGTALLRGTGVAPQVAFSPSNLTNLGGGFSEPHGIAVDPNGNVYVGDRPNNTVKEIPLGCASSSCVVNLGGGFNFPAGVALDGAGNIYVADSNNGALKEMPPGCASSSCVTTLGGGFFEPYGVAVDGSGNIYVADGHIKEMPPGCASSTCVTTLGGGLGNAEGVALDNAGNIYIADSETNAVLKMPAGCGSSACVTTLGGGFYNPLGVAVDSAGNVYVADAYNAAVREKPAGCASSVCVTTLINEDYVGAVALDSSGNVYAAQGVNATAVALEIRRATPPVLTFAETPVGQTSTDSPQTVTVENIGNATLNVSAVTYPPDFPEAAGVSTDCTSSTDLAPGSICTLSMDFSPLLSSATGLTTFHEESVSLSDNNLNGSGANQSVTVSGLEDLPGAALSSPAANSVLAGPAVTFTWSAESDVTSYTFQLGNTAGGSDLFSTGATTSTSAAVTGLPTNGKTIYARLCTQYGSYQACNSYAFTAATPAKLTAPTPGTELTGPKITFTWSTGTAATAYKLWIGTSAGKNDLYTSGAITTTSATPSLPTNGETLYATLVTVYGATQVSSRYLFTAASPAALTSPTPSTVLAGPKVTFNWTAAPGATAYKLWIGSSAGKNDLYTSGTTTSTSATPGALPTNGESIYVTLITVWGASQATADYTFTAATAAALTSPTPSTVLAGSKITFNWSAAAGATGYKLWIGTTAGKYNLYTSGTITTTSVTPASLPVNGETIYVTLITVYGTVQIYADYTFTAATPAALNSPTPGTQLSGAQVTFNWSAAPGATAYKLWIGSAAGKNDLYSSGPITLTYATPTKLPTNGEAVYVTLVTVYPSSTVNEAYTFTAAP